MKFDTLMFQNDDLNFNVKNDVLLNIYQLLQSVS